MKFLTFILTLVLCMQFCCADQESAIAIRDNYLKLDGVKYQYELAQGAATIMRNMALTYGESMYPGGNEPANLSTMLSNASGAFNDAYSEGISILYDGTYSITTQERILFKLQCNGQHDFYAGTPTPLFQSVQFHISASYHSLIETQAESAFLSGLNHSSIPGDPPQAAIDFANAEAGYGYCTSHLETGTALYWDALNQYSAILDAWDAANQGGGGGNLPMP